MFITCSKDLSIEIYNDINILFCFGGMHLIFMHNATYSYERYLSLCLCVMVYECLIHNLLHTSKWILELNVQLMRLCQCKTFCIGFSP